MYNDRVEIIADHEDLKDYGNDNFCEQVAHYTRITARYDVYDGKHDANDDLHPDYAPNNNK